MRSNTLLKIFCISVCIVLVSCAGINEKHRGLLKPDEKYIDCRPVVDEKNKGSPMLRCAISYDQLNFFTPPGTKLIMMADSGERLELWWTIDWLGMGYIFPRWRFALMYFNPKGKEELISGVRIGECRFREGCNHGAYFGPDMNKNNTPDYFTEIIWDNWDYGDDDGVKGYLDHYQHVYKPLINQYTVTRFLYFYPEKCTPPVSPRDEVCKISEECKPPYRLKEKKIIKSMSF
ncbi:MAG: hypothetical protein N3D15_08815 [Syntrophorhabdaceae bacterium]|nr:hypothetical protein [Syntrophorhabdaceae bacterium]